MKDPVVTKYGHSYERAALVEWIANNGGGHRTTCPLTRQPLALCDVISHRSLQSRIEVWKKLFFADVDDITTVTTKVEQRKNKQISKAPKVRGQNFYCFADFSSKPTTSQEADDTEDETDDEEQPEVVDAPRQEEEFVVGENGLLQEQVWMLAYI